MFRRTGSTATFAFASRFYLTSAWAGTFVFARRILKGWVEEQVQNAVRLGAA